MNRRVAVRAIIDKDGKLFAIKLKDYQSDSAKTVGKWITVGGSVEPNEPLLKALEREVIEEVGIKPDIGNLLYVQQFIHHNTEQLEFFFNVKNADDFINIKLNETSHGEIEIAEFGFIDPIGSGILPDFIEKEDLNNLSNQPVKFFSYL